VQRNSPCDTDGVYQTVVVAETPWNHHKIEHWNLEILRFSANWQHGHQFNYRNASQQCDIAFCLAANRAVYFNIWFVWHTIFYLVCHKAWWDILSKNYSSHLADSGLLCNLLYFLIHRCPWYCIDWLKQNWDHVISIRWRLVVKPPPHPPPIHCFQDVPRLYWNINNYIDFIGLNDAHIYVACDLGRIGDK
jgi:hypothetical protein